MSDLSEHPTVTAYRQRPPAAGLADPIPHDWLRNLCLDAGAADVGFVSIDRPAIADERPHILQAFPKTRTLVSIVTQLHPTSVRAPARSIGNIEFHRSLHDVEEVAQRIILQLEALGVPSLRPAAGFPMEMSAFPGRTWVVAHKPIAVAAGLGQIGIHRNVIHPKFGSFITLETILVSRDVAAETPPVAFNPCLECKLCVAACPVGAIEPDGYFNFAACLTHNYRDFMTGFEDWAQTIADARDGRALRDAVPSSEQASMWQSLSFGANYKAAYCLAVCPAGEDVIGPYLESKGQFKKDVVKPLQDKAESVYVLPSTDAAAHVAKRFPAKTARFVRNTLLPYDIRRFLMGLRASFQRGKAADLSAIYHFSFTGVETCETTVRIHARRLEIDEGLVGTPDVRIGADSAAWLRFIRKECGLLGLILRRKVRIKGSLRLLQAFGRCFP